MDFERLMNIMDSCWSGSSSLSFCNETKPETEAEVSRVQTRHKKSKSVDSSSNTSSDNLSCSPDSVLFTPKLETILSGKESTEGEDCKEEDKKGKKKSGSEIKRRRKKGLSKSLSDLEFEELKGLMDLGFVFTEEDNRDSRLVEIVPGLQKLRRDSTDVSRPYLSEAWEVLEMKNRRKNPVLMNWKIPALGNEIDMKDNLKWWAHTVASAVK